MKVRDGVFAFTIGMAMATALSDYLIVAIVLFYLIVRKL